MKTKNLPLQLYSLLLMSYLVVLLLYLRSSKSSPSTTFCKCTMCGFCRPWYGLAQALISSLIRITFGTGSAFAFPGSMIGVFLASLFYMYRKHIFMAAVGEVIGTGIIGSLMCIPLSWILGLQHFFIKPLMLVFVVSSFLGAAISYILLIVLKTWIIR